MTSGRRHGSHKGKPTDNYRPRLSKEQKAENRRKASKSYYARYSSEGVWCMLVPVPLTDAAKTNRAAVKVARRRWDPPKAGQAPPISPSSSIALGLVSPSLLYGALLFRDPHGASSGSDDSAFRCMEAQRRIPTSSSVVHPAPQTVPTPDERVAIEVLATMGKKHLTESEDSILRMANLLSSHSSDALHMMSGQQPQCEETACHLSLRVWWHSTRNTSRFQPTFNHFIGHTFASAVTQTEPHAWLCNETEATLLLEMVPGARGFSNCLSIPHLHELIVMKLALLVNTRLTECSAHVTPPRAEAIRLTRATYSPAPLNSGGGTPSTPGVGGSPGVGIACCTPAPCAKVVAPGVYGNAPRAEVVAARDGESASCVLKSAGVHTESGVQSPGVTEECGGLLYTGGRRVGMHLGEGPNETGVFVGHDDAETGEEKVRLVHPLAELKRDGPMVLGGDSGSGEYKLRDSVRHDEDWKGTTKSTFAPVLLDPRSMSAKINLPPQDMVPDQNNPAHNPRFWYLPPIRDDLDEVVMVGWGNSNYEFHLVTEGREVGVWRSWTVAKEMVSGYPRNGHKGHHTYAGCIAEWQQHCPLGKHPHPVDPKYQGDAASQCWSRDIDGQVLVCDCFDGNIGGGKSAPEAISLHRSQPHTPAMPSRYYAIWGAGVVYSTRYAAGLAFNDAVEDGDEPELLSSENFESALAYAEGNVG
ncbi:hypothetical protein C8R43DRAFT_966172 [Mycena crocata]|nr:hypothetical protein C8R43DRAFT_966172 [Mycena crocata]